LSERSSYGERADVAHHESFLFHARFRWLKIAVLLSALSIAAFWFLNIRAGFPLKHSGSTALGYTLGTVGALIIVWLTLIGIRKRAMTDGYWSLKAWLSAHVYLGLSLLVIVTLHTGFDFGWNVHTLAYALMVLVIVSGAFGAIAYMYLPVQLSEARGNFTRAQLLETVRQLDERILDAAQPLERDLAVAAQLSLKDTILGGSLWRRLTGYYRGCGNRRAMAILKHKVIGPSASDAEIIDRIAGLLARKEEILHKIREYARVRAYLETWLYIHVPMTFALLAALTAHIVSVFFLL
jgi:hypothetical protein